MSKTLKLLLMLLCAVAAFPQSVQAQSDTVVVPRVITNVKMVGIGSANVLDTYLSAEMYRGTELRYISHTTRQTDGRHWSRQIVHQGNIAYAESRSSKGSEMVGLYNFQYAWHRNWTLLGGSLRLKAGVMADANLGFVYNMRNSNNPAQARASLNVAPSAAAAYDFRLWQKPFAVRYEVSAPLCGLMFSPNYGQSYYEIFTRGNYDHNLVPTTFVSAPSLRQMLTLDFSIRHTTLRVGYLGDFQQSHVNNLKSHIYSHNFVIGLVKRFKLIKIRP